MKIIIEEKIWKGVNSQKKFFVESDMQLDVMNQPASRNSLSVFLNEEDTKKTTARKLGLSGTGDQQALRIIFWNVHSFGNFNNTDAISYLTETWLVENAMFKYNEV